MSQVIRNKHTCVKLRIDDEVVILSGKEKDKRGRIMSIDRTRGRVVVQGVNRARRFQKPTQENPQGGQLEIEMPLHISNVAYYDAKNKKGVRLSYQNIDDKKVRAFREDGKFREIKEKSRKSNK